jgi:hypothetical protein
MASDGRPTGVKRWHIGNRSTCRANISRSSKHYPVGSLRIGQDDANHSAIPAFVVSRRFTPRIIAGGKVQGRDVLRRSDSLRETPGSFPFLLHLHHPARKSLRCYL